MNTSFVRRGRVATGAVAAGALFASGLLLAGPAQAATTVNVTSFQVGHPDTRATGHNDFLPTDGVHVYTEGSTSTDKADGYFAINTPLADAAEPALSWTDTSSATANRPGLQLVIDFDGNGTTDGTLVGEPTAPGYGNDWWLTNGSAQTVKDAAPSHTGGFGSANHGTLDAWRANFPNAKISATGWSLGSGVLGDGVINSITVGSTKYVFVIGTAPPVAPEANLTVKFGRSGSVTLAATSSAPGKLKYSVGTSSHGKVSVSKSKVTFKPTKGFAGTTDISYTVTDSQGNSTNGVIHVTVLRFATSFEKLSGKTSHNVTTISGETEDDDASASGGSITVTLGPDTVGTTTVSKGKFSVVVGNDLPDGKYKYVVTFGGTTTAAPVSKSITIKVDND